MSALCLWAGGFSPSRAQEPSVPLQQGIQALKENRTEEAINLFRRAIQEDPRSGEPYFYLGVAFQRIRRFEEAEAAYRKAMELDPAAPEIRFRLGALFEDRGRLPEALEAYRDAVERAGDAEVGQEARRRLTRIEIRLHFARVLTLTREDKSREALSEFEAIIRLDPGNAEAYFGMGEIYRRFREWDKALEYTEKAVEYDPDHFRAHYYLAQFYEARLEWEKARQAYDRVIALRPETPEGKEAAGRLVEVRKQIRIEELLKQIYGDLNPLQEEKAREGIEALFAIAPDHFMAYYFRGFFEETRKRYEEAIRDLSRAIELSPDFFPAISKLGQVYGRIGNFDKASSLLKSVIDRGKPEDDVVQQARSWLEDIEKARTAQATLEEARGALERGEMTETIRSLEETIRLQPNEPDAYLTLALFYQKGGDGEKALETLRRAVENNPTSAQAHLQLGLLLEQRGELPESRHSLQQALSLGKGKPEGEVAGKHLQSVEAKEHFQESNIQVGKGDFQAALQEIQRVTALFPDDPSAYLSEGIIYDRMDRSEEAIASFRKAIALDPRYVNAYIQLGIVFETTGRFEEAQSQYETALSLNPAEKTAELVQGRLRDLDRVADLYHRTENARRLLDEKKYEESLAEIEALIDLEPSNYMAHFLRGVNYTGLKQTLKAIESYKKALELSPKSNQIRFQLARIYMDEGRFEEAREELERVVREAPGTKEGDLAAVGLKRLRDLSYSFGFGQSMDSNLAQRKTAVRGVTSSLNVGLNYILVRRKNGSLMGGGTAQQNIYYRTQGVGNAFSGSLTGLYRLGERWMLNARFNRNFGFFEGEKTSASSGFSVGASMAGGDVPSQMQLKYGLVQARSFRSASGNANQHSASITLSQQFSPRDRGDVTYAFTSNVNLDPLGSNFGYRSNGLQLGYSREMTQKLSGSLGASGTYFRYSNPDSGSLFRRFRQTFQYGFSGGLRFPLSERVGFNLNYSYIKSNTNIEVGAKELLELDEILSSPIPLVGGDYERHTISIAYSMSF